MTTEPKPLTVLEKLEDEMNVARRAMDHAKARGDEKQASYYNGVIIGLDDAHKLMKRYIERLDYEFRTGMLNESADILENRRWGRGY